jgi:N-formylglutamate amidohydrolase
MTDAVRQHEPGGQPIPLVLDSPHSGTAYPDDFDHLPPRAIVRQAEDTHVEALYAAAPAIGATLIEALFPRAYIDPNRHRSDIDPELLADAWTGPITLSRKTELGIGLVWRLAHGGVPMYARKLSAAEVRRRITDFYDPYHACVSAALDRRHAAFGAVWHINCHSMPAVGDVMSEDPGRARADFVLGDRDGSTCAPEFTAFVARTLTGLGYDVAINDPYKGVELVRAFSDPAAHRHSLQIEVNRRLYMDERTREKTSGFDTLRANLDRLLEAVSAYAAQRIEGHHHDHDPHGDGHDHAHGHEHPHDHGHGHGHRH